MESEPTLAPGTPLFGADAPRRAEVLVVDDEPYIVLVISSLLERQGHRVVAAENAQQAFSLLQELGELGAGLPRVILSDVNMPGTSGLEFAEWLFADSRLAGIPILFLTGQADDVIENATPNVKGMLRKPFSPRHLAEELERLLNASPAVPFGEAA